MEAALGGNSAAVRVHVSPYAETIGARAFTRGTDLFFAPGAYDPTSPQGLQLLGHELVHVVQQAQGRVAVNAQIGGAPANTDASLEQEADVKKFLAGFEAESAKSVSDLLQKYAGRMYRELEELKRARVAAKLGEMSPEELAKAKQAWEEGIRAVDDAAKELAPGADKIAELKKSLTPVLPHAGDVSGPSLVMLDKLDKSVLPKLKAADAAELDRLGKMLVEDPALAERLAKSNNPYGALKKSKTLREMDNALFTGRLGELKVNPVRIGPAADKSGIPAADLAKLTDADGNSHKEPKSWQLRRERWPTDFQSADSHSGLAELLWKQRTHRAGCRSSRW